MADIQVKDLSSHNISGFNLFEDSENFMIELSAENEFNIYHILGGMLCYHGTPHTSTICDGFTHNCGETYY
jgi:hypothetical protein